MMESEAILFAKLNETLDNVFGHNITSDSYFEKLKNADRLENL